MALFKLCSRDPLMDILRDTFHATPVKIPEERYTPLGVIARYSNKDKFLGTVTNFLTDPAPYPREPETSQMANISGSRTKTVDFSLGFDILDGFLKGMGINGGAIKANFSGITKVSFSFQHVTRRYYDIGAVGNFLKRKQFDKTNPATGFFFNEDAACIVIDSTINSNNFSLHVEEKSAKDFKLDIPAIQATVGNLSAGITAERTDDLTISFTGNKSLAFAFSAVTFVIAGDGMISFGREVFEQYTSKNLVKGIIPVLTPDRVLLYGEDGMIVFD